MNFISKGSKIIKDMENKLLVSPSPHIHSGNSTQRLMRDVLIALIPTFAVTVFYYGLAALTVTLIAVLACVVFEFLISRYILKMGNTITDFSAILTGVLLGFNLPSSTPWWMICIGALIAIGVAKMSFGGLGTNVFNPALVGRVFLLISFPATMTVFPSPENTIDAVTAATPLTYIKEAAMQGIPMDEALKEFSNLMLLLGNKAGSIGEIGSLSLLLGLVYMLYRKVITWHIPTAILGTMFVFSGILWLANPAAFVTPVFQILSGGALLGAIFMATDYVTSPMSKKGMLIYGIGIGFLTITIRTWGGYAEGISFAILIMNAATPLINKYTKPKRFGEKVNSVKQ